MVFYDTPVQAEAAGFRACKRCKPDVRGGMPEEGAVGRVKGAVRSLEGIEMEKGEKGGGEGSDGGKGMEGMTLEEMARRAGVSKWHFWRVFKKVHGISVGEWRAGKRRGDLTSGGRDGGERGMANAESGLGASAEAFTPVSQSASLGTEGVDGEEDFASYMLQDVDVQMDWNEFDAMMAQQMPDWSLFDEVSGVSESPLPPFPDPPSFQTRPVVHFAIRQTALGLLMIAFQSGKVCMVQQDTNEDTLAEALERKFPTKEFDCLRLGLEGDEMDAGMKKRIDEIVGVLES